MFNAPPSPPDRCREPAAIISFWSCGFMFLSVSQSGTLSGFYVGSMIMADNNPHRGLAMSDVISQTMSGVCAV